MLQRILGVLALVVLFAGTGTPKEEKKAADVVADVARTIGAANVKSVQYSATGFVFTFGQSFQPGGPWPKFLEKLHSHAGLRQRRLP